MFTMIMCECHHILAVIVLKIAILLFFAGELADGEQRRRAAAAVAVRRRF
jgi:hypothetical protein